MRVQIILLHSQHTQMPNHFEKFKVWLLRQHLYWSAACDLFQMISAPATLSGFTELWPAYKAVITQTDNDVIWSYALLLKNLNVQFAKI